MPENINPVNSKQYVNQELENAIKNAQVLLAYASSNGISFDHMNINSIIKSWNSKIISEEEEISFWTQYSKLAAAVFPATPESIQAMNECSGKKSQLSCSVRKYTRFTVVTLIVLVIVQAYWTFGNFITADIRNKKEESAQIEDTITRYEREDERGATGQRESRRYVTEIKILETERENLGYHITSNYKWLKVWSSPYELFLSTTDESKEPDPDNFIEENISRIQSSTIILEIMQIYILPLIYGFLGTCVYILRDLSTKTKECAFTQASTINFNIRLCLGALSGITSAWIISSGTPSDSFMSLSPLAIAFLVGYSIEILFAAMDTFISAFTGKRTPPAAVKGKEQQR